MSHVLNNVEKYQKLVDALNDFFCDTGVEPHMTAALLEKFGADVLCLAKFIRINGNDPDPRSQTLRAAVLPDAPEPPFTYQWHCIECGEWHPEGVFHCPKAAHSQSSGGG